MLKKVAIVGAGLGGLAVAIALHKQGINAQVYEKAGFLRSVGAGLSILPNGLNSLDAIAPTKKFHKLNPPLPAVVTGEIKICQRIRW